MITIVLRTQSTIIWIRVRCFSYQNPNVINPDPIFPIAFSFYLHYQNLSDSTLAAIVSSDLITAVTFGIVNIITSVVALLLAYCTLRYMIRDTGSSSSLQCSVCLTFFAHYVPAQTSSRNFETGLLHRHEHTYVLPLNPESATQPGLMRWDYGLTKDESGRKNS